MLESLAALGWVEESATDGYVCKLFRKAQRNFATAQVFEHARRRWQEARSSPATRQRSGVWSGETRYGECPVCLASSCWEWAT